MIPQNLLTIYFWVRTTSTATNYPALATNKNWNSGQIQNYTTSNSYGFSRSSGQACGWAIALQPNGAWAWNLGDGKRRLDYQPTAARQAINDGQWHLLAFSMDRTNQEARIYYDGQQVALYSLTELSSVDNMHPLSIEFPGEIKNFTAIDQLLPDTEIARIYQQHNGLAPISYPIHSPSSPLRVLAWNIWNGGREDGIDLGVQRVIECIQESDADLVAMQETYGSGPRIADALGYHLYLRSSNIAVISRYPATASHDLFQPFNLGGITLSLTPQQQLNIFSLWIHYLPDFCTDVRQQDITAAHLIAAEEQTRGAEIRAILKTLVPHLASNTPLIVAGDFNSPSHLDWVAAAKEKHGNLVVEWPVSKQMVAAEFVDAYRQIYPDPNMQPGHTWTPRNPQSWQDRIDYVYYHDSHLCCLEARVINQHPVQWPSDHAAVLTTFKLTP